MTTAVTKTTFELRDAIGDVIPDVFGVWYVPPTDLAFDTPGTTSRKEPPAVWSVTLSVDPTAAAASLVAAEGQLVMAEQALDEGLARLATYAPLSSDDLAFDLLDDRTAMHRPEARLSVLLDELAGGAEVIFDPRGGAGDTWEQVSEEFQAFMRRLHQNITHYALVQTRASESQLGCTVVGWSGDTNTVWRAGVSAEQISLHQRTLALALASRAKMLRMFALATRGAVILARAAASPVGPVLAVPAAWRFLNDVMAELRREEEPL